MQFGAKKSTSFSPQIQSALLNYTVTTFTYASSVFESGSLSLTGCVPRVVQLLLLSLKGKESRESWRGWHSLPHCWTLCCASHVAFRQQQSWSHAFPFSLEGAARLKTGLQSFKCRAQRHHCAGKHFINSC